MAAELIINLEMSLPVVDIGSAEMRDHGFVCLAPALIAPPLAASEAPNGTESLDEVSENDAKQLDDVGWVLESIRVVKRPRIGHRQSFMEFWASDKMDFNFGFGGR